MYIFLLNKYLPNKICLDLFLNGLWYLHLKQKDLELSLSN